MSKGVVAKKEEPVSKAASLGRGRTQARVAPPNGSHVPSRTSAMHKSASYTALSDAKNRVSATPALLSLNDGFAQVDLSFSAGVDDVADISTPDSSGCATPEQEPITEHKFKIQQAHELIAELQRQHPLAIQQVTEVSEDGGSSTASSISNYRLRTDSSATTSTISTAPTTPKPRSSIASNFSRRLSRKSWLDSTSSAPSSRSPSPPKKGTLREPGTNADPGKTPAAFPTREHSLKPPKLKDLEKRIAQESNEQHEQGATHEATPAQKKKIRPPSTFFKTSHGSSPNTSKAPLPPLPKSFSTEKLPSQQFSPDRAAPMPRLLSSERVPVSKLGKPRKKDELWTVFRTLDADYSRFCSKSLSLKASVVRSSLLPFLRSYVAHSSNWNLRPEDLDRRTNILNKWWTGLLELLHGRNNKSVVGTDRPAILDAISGIMDRPEWRPSLSPFCPLDQRTTVSSLNRSATSLTSDSSEFLIESVHHNVRNIFMQNLSAQMTYIVDKMSERNASASLVTFCGKACAFAFMFVPGMADVLARLWDIQADVFRRVLDGNGVGKFDNLSSVAEKIVPSFPPGLHQLGFFTLVKFMRTLRKPPPLPVGTSNVQWWGYWLERWCGKESALFYVFVKHFHLLAADFLPTNAKKQERITAPGFLLVQAQILVNLDATIHRDAYHHHDASAPSTNPTFDGILQDPDTIAPTLPLLPNNASRLMAENRMIMLIRDFLSDRAAESPTARRIFAESFMDLLETATRGTSMFDYNACYTLLDFLEEAMILLVRFEHLDEHESKLFKFDFWQTVWAKMIESHQTTIEIRLYSFLYTIWNAVVCEVGWKASLCFDFLLNPEIFESRFNHWCPMVRAYYMRLLCWRVGRCDGEYSSDDLQILETLLDRLRTTWSHYLFLRGQSDGVKTVAPPTNPSNPAPNRRLLIIRTDAPTNNRGAFLSFDGIIPPESPSRPASVALKRNSTISLIEVPSRPTSPGSISDPEEAETRGRGIGGFIRNLITTDRSKSKSRTRSKPKQDPPPTTERSNGITRAATDDLSQTPPRVRCDPPIKLASHQNFSFKFSLEYHPHAKPPPPMRLNPPRLPMAAQSFLMTYSRTANNKLTLDAIEPTGASKAHACYCGRALAEWAVILSECQSFFDRRKNEGVPTNKLVETPTLGVEVFKRPG